MLRGAESDKCERRVAVVKQRIQEYLSHAKSLKSSLVNKQAHKEINDKQPEQTQEKEQKQDQDTDDQELGDQDERDEEDEDSQDADNRRVLTKLEAMRAETESGKCCIYHFCCQLSHKRFQCWTIFQT